MKTSTATSLLRNWFFILPYAGNWHYDESSSWRLQYPDCEGNRQSPLELYTEQSYFDPSLQLKFHHYKKPLLTPVEVHNNGYAAEVGVRFNEDGSRPSVSMRGRKEFFEVQQLHFHWGSWDGPGSEHTIDGYQYDVEMHVLHKNAKYDTIEEAREHPDGFLVLGVLFQAVPYDLTKGQGTLKKFYDALESITNFNSTAELEGTVTMASFLPDLDLKNYFAYEGSLTTPPCSESVFWFVFTDVLPIPYKYLTKFWNLLDVNDRSILNNFRPAFQANRPVFRKTRRFYLLHK